MRKIVLVDIDNTISKVGNRLKYLENSEWDKFHDECDKDEPIVDIIELIKVLEPHYEIVFCTERTENVRNKTKKWIGEHVYNDKKYGPLVRNLLMKEDGDFRNEVDVKPELLKKYGWKLTDIAFTIENRKPMVIKWREMGVRCLQVHLK